VSRPLTALLGFSLVVACSGDGTGPTSPAATALALLAQPSTSAQSGVAFPVQPVVQLRNAQGEAVGQADVLITAVVATGGGAIVGTAAQRTDVEGKATWTNLGLSGTVGERTLRFESPGLTSALSVPISLDAGAGAVITLLAGNNQVAAAGAALPILPRVRVTDAWDNPVPGAAVTFTVLTGDGTVEGGATQTAPDGTASPTAWRLGPAAGVNTLGAFLDGQPAASVTFTATATVGLATQLEVVEGNNQEGTIGTPLPTVPGVRALDSFGNPVPGITITFTPGSGSGTVSGGNATTNAQGIARVQSWVLGFALGAQSLTASRAGVPSVTITATGIAFLVQDLSAGGGSSCASDLAGLAWCWGSNSAGQIGDGTATPRTSPVQVGGGVALSGIAAGGGHACGLTPTGAARCWGANTNGQLGTGTLISQLQPAIVQGGHTFTQLAAGLVHTCGLRTGGDILCWGSNANGRLGDGTTTQRTVPTMVAGGPWVSVHAASSTHTCAVKPDGSAWCWGFNGAGRLGDGTLTDRSSPTLVLGDLDWQTLAAGPGHTCGIALGGSAYCWGTGGQGQLATGSANDISQPVPITGGHTLATVTVGTVHSCGLTAAGAAWCWGFNGSGRLGDGTTVARLEPVAVLGDAVFATMTAGGDFTCGMTTEGAAVCWGRNFEGRVGDGTTTDRLVPVAVKPPATP
jgi:alpha-tubulin suppressor-like RCC1 family protein